MEVIVLGIVALLIVLLVVRPLVVGISDATSAGRGRGQRVLARPGQEPEAPPPLTAAEAAMITEDEVDDGVLIDISRIEGRVKQSSVRKVSAVVDRHPEEAISIIRSWIHQDR